MSTSKDVVFVFQSGPTESSGPTMRGGLPTNMMKEFAVGLADVTSWFKDFEIDSIEVSITAGLETSGVTKLFVSANGQGGLTVTLKPKKQA